MMTPEETRARAERAAEWFNKGKTFIIEPRKDSKGWDLTCPESGSPGPYYHSDRALIAMAEDRGWRDPIPTEAESVVWLIKTFNWYINRDGTIWYLWGHDEFREINPVGEATRLGYAEGEG